MSIIVPVYKAEAWLGACVGSLLSQTYPGLDIMLIDDGSPDGCPAMCDAYAKADKRVRALHKPNSGLADVCNYGLERIRGDYVIFCDSDDTLDPHACADMLEAFKARPEADVVSAELCPFVEGSGTPLSVPSEAYDMSGAEFLWRMLACGNVPMSRCGKMYRAAVVKDVRMPLGILNEDIVFNAQVMTTCRRVVGLPRTYYRYRQDNADSITHSFKALTHIWDNVDRIDAMLNAQCSMPNGRLMKRMIRRYRGRVCGDIALTCLKHKVRPQFAPLRRQVRNTARRLAPRLVFASQFPLKERLKLIFAALAG